MNKRLLLTIVLLSSFFGVSIMSANAQTASAKAIWCGEEGVTTLYFLYDNASYTAGDTYDSHTISEVYNSTDVSDNRYRTTDIMNTCTTVIIQAGFQNAGVVYCTYMFKGFKALTSVTGLRYMINENTLSLYGMFWECTSLTTIDFTGVNTSSVTEMGCMFYKCSGLTSLDLSCFNTGDSNTGSVTRMQDMFNQCSNLSTLDLTNFDTSEVQYMQNMFCRCSSLTSLDLSSFNTSKVENMTYMFYSCVGLTSLDLSSFNTSNVKNMSWMFYNCTALQSISLSNFDTSEVTTMERMFADCEVLASLDVCHFNTGKVTTMYEMFKNCGLLTSLDVSHFNTSKVTTMADMFYHCSALTSLDLSSFDTSEVTSLNGMFSNCVGLTSLDLSSFNTSKVKNMSNVFLNCNQLTSLNVSSFNTSMTTEMVYMFKSCRSLTSLDLRSFNVSQVTNMNSMFSGDTELVTIYANTDWQHEGLTDDSFMFAYCNALKGNIDYSYSYITADYANPSTGYFTAKYEDAVMSFSSSGTETATIGTAFASPTLTMTPALPVTYSSSNEAVATVDASTGVVTPLAVGTATITAVVNDPQNVYLGSASYDLTVCKEAATLSFSQAEVYGEVGATFTPQLTTIPDGLTLTYTSSNTDLATVDAETGVVTLLAEGEVTITATVDDSRYEGSASYRITIAKLVLDNTEAILEKGKTLTLTATLTPSTLEDKSLTWKSSKTSVATVSADGVVTGVKAGTATITCTSDATGAKATCTVTVSYVKLDQTEAILEKGKTLTLTPTVYPSALEDKSVTWKSSKTSVATVSEDGVVTGVKAGTATITCTSNATGMKATCLLTVGYVKLDKTEAILEKGKTLTLTPTVYPSALTDKSVTWSSSDTKVATVSEDGVVTGVKSGTATITCTSNATGLSTGCTVTVGFVKLSKTTASVDKGKTLTLTPTVYPSTLEDKSVKWKSSNTKVATVSDGVVTGVKVGTATITCTSNATGLKTTCTVTVGYVKLDKTEALLEKGSTLTLTPTISPSALEDKSVKWKSSKTTVATVSADGVVTGVKAGTATITCTSNATGLKATCTVTVGYVKLDKTDVAVQKGKTKTLKATVYPSSLADRSVTWESSDTNVATVTSTGKVKGKKAGTVTITCTSNATGLKAACTVTVGYVKLDQTEVTVKKGKTVTLTATVYPSTLEDQSVKWESSDKTIATVTSKGKVKGIGPGTATITCTSNATGLKTTCTVTVTGSTSSRALDGDDDETTGIEEMTIAEPFDVYDLSGRKVLHQVTSLDGLPNGIYIVNGRKVLKKD